MNIWSRVWRWITLADVPTVGSWPPGEECFFCEEPAVVHVQINGKSWRTCQLHMGTPGETLRDRA